MNNDGFYPKSYRFIDGKEPITDFNLRQSTEAKESPSRVPYCLTVDGECNYHSRILIKRKNKAALKLNPLQRGS